MVSGMPKVALPAHYDGDQIRLDEPFRLPKDARLLVVLMSEPTEGEAWAGLSMAALARAYANDEPEYSTSDVRP
jgi:hypothetical protein